MLDDLDLYDWVSLFHNIIQRVLMNLCHRGKITKIQLCLIKDRRGLNPSEIHEQPIPHLNIQCAVLLI